MQHSPSNIFFRPPILAALAVFVLWLTLIALDPSKSLTDPDTQWHIASGDLYIEQGHVVTKDPWSFTAGDFYWINHSWLWDVAMSYVYQAGGWAGVAVASGIAVAGTLSILFFMCLARTNNGMAAFFTILVALSMMHTGARPLQITMLFTASTYLILYLVQTGAIRQRVLALIPLLIAIWANIHGGFIAAFVLLGAYGLQALLAGDRGLFRNLLITGLASMVAVLCNPYGYKIFHVVVLNMFGVMNAVIDEWQPLSLSLGNMAVNIYLPLFFLILNFRPPAMQLAERMLIAFWLIMGLSSARHLNIFAIISAPIISLSVATFFEKKTPANPRIQHILKRVGSIASSSKTLVFASIFVMSYSIFLMSPTAARLLGTEQYSPVTDLSNALGFIENHYPKTHFLNDYNLGGTLIFQSRGKLPVFIDGRADTAYPTSLLKDFVAISKFEPDWQQRLATYDIQGMLLASNSNFLKKMAFFPQWKRAYEDKNVVVLIHEKNS